MHFEIFYDSFRYINLYKEIGQKILWAD